MNRDMIYRGKWQNLRIAIAIATLVFLLAGSAGAAPFAYITNNDDTTVSVIDTATNTVTATVNVGGNPYGVAVNPAGTRVYVTNSVNLINRVSVIDTSTNTVTATVNVGGPYGVAVNPAGTKVYVANYFDNTVSVIDTATNTVTATVNVGNGPYGVAVNPAGTKVYVANYYDSTVSVIDTATNTVTASVPVGHGLYGVAVNPAGTKVYVASYFDTTVYVIDTATNTITATVNVGESPFGVAVNPAGTKVYVTKYDGTVSVIDTATNTVTATVNVGLSYAQGVAVNPAGTKVYVANNPDNSVSVIDTTTNTVTASVPVGRNPIAFGQFIGPERTVISIASQTVAPGGNVTLPIIASNVTDLSAFSITLSYNPAVVWVDSVTAGNFGTPVSNINNVTGSTSMSGISITGKSGNLVIANVVLKAVGTAGQTSPLNISVTEIVDSNGYAIPAAVLNGSFTIQTVSFTAAANRTNVSIATSPIASTPVEFTVMLGSSPVSGATVTLSGSAAGTGITAADGKVVIMVSPTRNGTIVATATHGSNTNTTALTAKGDVSGDNRVSITDALFIAQYTAGIRVLDSNTLVFADVSGDGRASITDALFIAQATAGIADRPVPKQGN